MIKQIIWLILLQSILCVDDSGTRVIGIGYGSFIIIISIIIGVLICIFAQTTRHPQIYSIVAIILPLFFILFFVFMPKKANSSTSIITTTDSSFIPHIIFTILIVLMFVAALALYILDKLMVYKRAKNIARTGVIYVTTNTEQSNKTYRRNLGNRGQNSELPLIGEEQD